MKRMFHSLLSFILSFIFVFSFSSYVFAEKPTLQYVALGDSLAAGFLNSQEIGEGYPVYIAQGIEEETLYQVNLMNYGVGGYTTEHLLEQIARTDVQQDIAKADFITIDIGANDILWRIGTDFDLTDPDELQRIVQEVYEVLSIISVNVEKILFQIQQLNPDVPIFFMEYYNALPYLDNQEMIELMITILNSTLQEVAEYYGAIFVPVYDAFDGMHDFYLPNPNDIHPTKEGYEVIASLFLEEIIPKLPPISSIPEISLYGDNPLKLKVGDTYEEPGFSAYDSIDGDLTEQIIITGEVNTNESGTYTITYSVTNSFGETALVERIIYVEEVVEAKESPPAKLDKSKTSVTESEKGQEERQSEKTTTEQIVKDSHVSSGEKLPTTATTYPTFIFIGVLLVVAGSILFVVRLNVFKQYIYLKS